MQVIKFEQKDSVGHIVLANPPKNLIASDFSNSLKQAVHEAGESDIRAFSADSSGKISVRFERAICASQAVASAIRCSRLAGVAASARARFKNGPTCESTRATVEDSAR